MSSMSLFGEQVIDLLFLIDNMSVELFTYSNFLLFNCYYFIIKWITTHYSDYVICLLLLLLLNEHEC